MAIVTIQASKATPTKGIAYITDEGKAPMMSVINLELERDWAEQMMDTAMLWNKAQGENERKYYHIKISFAPKDWTENGGKLTEAMALDIGMGILYEMAPGSESVGAVHNDRKHLHFHGIINAVDLKTGAKLHMNNADYRKIKDRVQEICAEKGLSALDWREATKQKRAAEKQVKDPIEETFAEKGLKSRGKVTWKDQLRSIIDDAAASSKSMDEFRAVLESQGVTLTRCTDKTISYKLGDHKACRGDTLGGDYTVQAIHDALSHNKSKPAAEHGKEHAGLSAQLRYSEKKRDAVIDGRYVSESDREIFRAAGREIGLKRAQIDEMCDKAQTATPEDIKAAWEAYRASQADYWRHYNTEKARIQKEYAEHLAWKRSHRNYWQRLYDARHRNVLESLLVLAIIIVKPELINPEDPIMAELRAERDRLRNEMWEHRIESAQAADRLRSYNHKLKGLNQRVEEIATPIIARSQKGIELNVIKPVGWNPGNWENR